MHLNGLNGLSERLVRSRLAAPSGGVLNYPTPAGSLQANPIWEEAPANN